MRFYVFSSHVAISFTLFSSYFILKAILQMHFRKTLRFSVDLVGYQIQSKHEENASVNRIYKRT
jgi:hypothetical protein